MQKPYWQNVIQSLQFDRFLSAGIFFIPLIMSFNNLKTVYHGQRGFKKPGAS